MTSEKKAFFLIFLFIILAIYWLSKGGIYNYDPKRDRVFILDLFKKNWYWLVEDGKEFSPEDMLDTISYFQKFKKIKVFVEKNKPAGFIVYYKASSLVGYILFICVHPDYRGKGYAEELLQYSFKDLKSKNCSKVKLVTRTSNCSAKKLYNKMGFAEFPIDTGFVKLEKSI